MEWITLIGGFVVGFAAGMYVTTLIGDWIDKRTNGRTG